MINWKIIKFNQLSNDELFDVIHERIRVFIISQHRIYQEIDDIDKIAEHLLGYENGKLVAYARIFEEDGFVTFGRVLTIPEVRGEGVGRELVNQIHLVIDTEFKNKSIEIEAQIDKQHFYEKFGYTAYGESFIFNLTEHIKMKRD